MGDALQPQQMDDYQGTRIVYETDRVTLWHGDARLVLPTFDTESFDLHDPRCS